MQLRYFFASYRKAYQYSSRKNSYVQIKLLCFYWNGFVYVYYVRYNDDISDVFTGQFQRHKYVDSASRPFLSFLVLRSLSRRSRLLSLKAKTPLSVNCFNAPQSLARDSHPWNPSMNGNVTCSQEFLEGILVSLKQLLPVCTCLTVTMLYTS